MYDLSFKNQPPFGLSCLCMGNPLKDRLLVCKSRDIQDSSGPFKISSDFRDWPRGRFCSEICSSNQGF